MRELNEEFCTLDELAELPIEMYQHACNTFTDPQTGLDFGKLSIIIGVIFISCLMCLIIIRRNKAMIIKDTVIDSALHM